MIFISVKIKIKYNISILYNIKHIIKNNLFRYEKMKAHILFSYFSENSFNVNTIFHNPNKIFGVFCSKY
jgi:hypothetical protein